MEEYFLHALPHVDMKILEMKNKARKPYIRGTPSKDYVLSQPEACNGKPIFLRSLSSVAQGMEQGGSASGQPGVV